MKIKNDNSEKNKKKRIILWIWIWIIIIKKETIIIHNDVNFQRGDVAKK